MEELYESDQLYVTKYMTYMSTEEEFRRVNRATKTILYGTTL